MAKIDLGQIVGKSAYQSAVEGGYQGTEEEFNKIIATISDINKVQEITLSNTAATSFSVSVSGITAKDSPILDIKMSGTIKNMQTLQEEWAKVLKAETGNGTITFTLSEPLSQSIIVLVKGK